MALTLLEQPVAQAEYLAVNTETNGLAGDLCELTEVGAVLVGGGECHDTWESLVRVERPLSRGIERFTGITQAMVDAAPPPDRCCRELAGLLEGRVLVAHSARFDTRVLAQAFERAGLDWPEPPALCTVSLARRFAPLVRKRGLAVLADALGIEVDEVHRALPDARTCARVFCSLFPRLCANSLRVGDAVDLLRPRRAPARAPQRRSRAPSAPTSRARPTTRASTSSATTAAGRCTSANRCRCARRARAHFCQPAGWTGEPRWWTTAPPTPSSGPSCSRTG